ncbi:catecholate siderophore receptor Fiu [Stenotrophomonas daejeonensis]|uniref:Catecholate siderophore receptor Fiu n=1 Tax=Stenotrophomonas daejeonensis TaxID=659018 RepID=A0A0R0E059_9GAMM|nr:catecholate siderophore receptor Fiu [Stenotrophomonas daejeonensis]KRG87676.1 catecholate siderophore receptor Fiu [Stenotrophomonas daejeonensis]
MSHIKSRKHASPARTVGHLATAGLVTGLSLAALPGLAHAEAPPDARTLDQVEVHATRGYKSEKSASPKFTQTLQNTPQTVQVITGDLFNQQGATTLTEALRNSAGVGTFYAGENGNTSTGDTVYMRGFDTSSSIFVDGVRDLGSISRDVFNTEQVEVVKGPAGTDNGRSAPTGAINMVSKQAHLHDAVSGTVSAGVDGQQRATADWNQTLGETSALRLNGLWQDSDVAGRDHVNNSRWGIAPSLGFGLGTDTRYHLNLLYLKQDNIPDGFVPTIGLPGWEPQPGLEQLAGHPVDPENFYGTRYDHDDVTAQQATFRFEHDFSDTLKLSNIARWGKTEQDYLLTAFMSTGGNVDNPLAGNIKWTDIDDLSSYTLKRSNLTYKNQENTILTDQLNLRADFATGSVQHNLSTGLEFTREQQKSWGLAGTVDGNWTPANLYHPDWNASGLSTHRTGAHNDGKTTTSSLYLFDTLKFGESFMLTAGVRADHYKTEYANAAVCGGRGGPACGSNPAGTVIASPTLEDSDTLVNWKLGAVYKPVEAIRLYANYALSQQPPGGSNFQLNESPNSANSINMDPQETRTAEVGSKWSFLDDALALNLALFRTEVTNEITGNNDDGYYQNGQKTVEGVEISTVGRITDNWSVSAGYTHQKTQVDKGGLLTADGSNNLTYTPEDAFTSWTTYSFPFGLTIGGGVRYSGEMHRGTDGAKGTPAFTKSYSVYDAMASYTVNDHLVLRLNAYNLFDKQYVAAINKSGYRYTPGTPRTFLFSADFHF